MQMQQAAASQRVCVSMCEGWRKSNFDSHMLLGLSDSREMLDREQAIGLASLLHPLTHTHSRPHPHPKPSPGQTNKKGKNKGNSMRCNCGNICVYIYVHMYMISYQTRPVNSRIWVCTNSFCGVIVERNVLSDK